MAKGCRFDAVTKVFGALRANDSVSFEIQPGTIHGVVGENGAGKSTIMKILYGLYQPDGGQLYFDGKQVAFTSPLDAIAAGIGMVHQHFMLVPDFSVWENVVLGAEPSLGTLPKAALVAKINELQTEFGIKLPLEAKVSTLSVGQQQQIEILKALYRAADFLILDEPTAVLTPQEVDALFEKLRGLKAAGKTIVLITHKLKEVLALTDAVTVLRRGKVVAAHATATLSEQSLAEAIVGRSLKALPLRAPTPAENPAVLSLDSVSTFRPKRGDGEVLDQVSLQVRRGEILGIAGIEGNGQKALADLLSQRLLKFTGNAALLERPLSAWNRYEKKQQGFGAIPLDRHEEGLVLGFTVQENLSLGHHWEAPWSSQGIFLQDEMKKQAALAVAEFDIRPPDPNALCKTLSGGNQQKVILARETRGEVRFLLCCHPTRGVDVGAIEFIHAHLLKLREQGAAILLISSELDEIFALSDRIAVLYQGRVAGESNRQQATESQIGLWMTGCTQETGNRPARTPA